MTITSPASSHHPRRQPRAGVLRRPDYAVNATVPLYLRLLQCLIEDAIDLAAAN